MAKIKKLVVKMVLAGSLVGCANSNSRFYDSAMNDRNRAPASLGVPESFNPDVTAIDPLHNQAEADFLFLRSEIESAAGHSADSLELLKSAVVYDSESATLMQKLAIEYYKNSKVTEAIEWAEKALAKAPDRRELSLLVAGLYTSTKDYEKAEAVYKGLLKTNAHDNDALLYLGAVYTEQKNYPLAVQSFQKLAHFEKYPSQHLAHYYLARVYSEMGRAHHAKVLSELRQAVSLKPDFFEAVSMLGHLIEKDQGARKAYAFYEELQRKSGPQPKLAEILAQYYIAGNDFDKAYEQLEILDESSEDLVQVKLKMALILIDKKVYDKAITKLEEILVIAPESDKVRFYLAAVHEEKHDFKGAFENYLKIEPGSSYFEDSRLHASYISKLLGNTDRAIALMQESVEKKAENPNSFLLLSQLLEDKKDLPKALSVLEKASARFPKNAQVLYSMGTLQDKMNLKPAMIESMRQVISLEPDHAQALNFLAYSWAEKGEQLELAEDYARKAALKEKEDAFILDTLGWVLFKKGDYKGAAEALEKAHDMQPQVSIILEHLGDVYTKMNLPVKARAIFIKAVESEDDFERKKEINSKLSVVEDGLKSARVPSSVGPGSDKDASP